MGRLLVVAIASLIVAPGIVAGRMGMTGPVADRLPAIGLAAGILFGVGYFFTALSSGQGLIHARLARDSERPNDPNAAISMGLGAAGIGCSVASNAAYPPGFRTFYAACAATGLLIALVNAWRAR